MARTVGRPVKYKTVEELQAALETYFNSCDNRLVQGYDDKTNSQFAYINPAPYTMSGLARALGLSRQGLMEYKAKGSFSDAIREARERVHEDVETRLMGTRNEKGAIFNLKNNFGWKDETKTDITSNGETIAPNVTINTKP